MASERHVRRHRPTWRRRTWRQYVASGSPGFPARVLKMCLPSSGDMCTPTGDPPDYIYLHCVTYCILCIIAHIAMGASDPDHEESSYLFLYQPRPVPALLSFDFRPQSVGLWDPRLPLPMRRPIRSCKVRLILWGPRNRACESLFGCGASWGGSGTYDHALLLWLWRSF